MLSRSTPTPPVEKRRRHVNLRRHFEKTFIVLLFLFCCNTAFAITVFPHLAENPKDYSFVHDRAEVLSPKLEKEIESAFEKQRQLPLRTEFFLLTDTKSIHEIAPDLQQIIEEQRIGTHGRGIVMIIITEDPDIRFFATPLENAVYIKSSMLSLVHNVYPFFVNKSSLKECDVEEAVRKLLKILINMSSRDVSDGMFSLQ